MLNKYGRIMWMWNAWNLAYKFQCKNEIKRRSTLSTGSFHDQFIHLVWVSSISHVNLYLAVYARIYNWLVPCLCACDYLPNQSSSLGVFVDIAVAAVEISEPVKLQTVFFYMTRRKNKLTRKENYKKITTGSKNHNSWCSDFLVELNLICFIYFVHKEFTHLHLHACVWALATQSGGMKINGLQWLTVCIQTHTATKCISVGQVKIYRMSLMSIIVCQ